MDLLNERLQDYNRSGDWQLKVNLDIIDFFPEILHDSVYLSKGYLIIADYACSEGLNSMIFFERAIRKFRETCSKEIFIVHTDLPNNNWTVLNNLFNNSPNSHLKLPGTCYSTMGRSFFERLFHPNSIHVGFSTYGFQYLSGPPVRKKGVTSLIHDGLIEQSIKDIHTILRHRIDELCPNGTLTFLVPIGDDDYNPEFHRVTFTSPFSGLVRRGLITQEQFEKIELVLFLSKAEAWKDALNDFADEIEVKKFVVTKQVCPYYEKYLEDGNLEQYQNDYVNWGSGFGRVLLFGMLKGDDESKQLAYNALKEEIKIAIAESKSEIYFHVLVGVIKKK